MKWKSKLDEVGLTEQTASQGIRTKIADYNTINDGINEVNELIANPSVNDDVEELKSDLIDLTDALEQQDKVIVKAITLFDKNKEHYSNLQKNLAEKRSQKAGNTAVSNATPTPAKKVENNIPIKEEPVVASVGGVVKEEKKKDSWSWVLLGGLALVVTLGAVNIFNKE